MIHRVVYYCESNFLWEGEYILLVSAVFFVKFGLAKFYKSLLVWAGFQLDFVHSTKIRLSRISSRNFSQPAEFVKKSDWWVYLLMFGYVVPVVGIWWWSWWMQTCAKWYKWILIMNACPTCSIRCYVASSTSTRPELSTEYVCRTTCCV